MKQQLKKHYIPFFTTVCICSVFCLLLGLLLPRTPAQEVPADHFYSAAPYEQQQQSDILLEFDDLPMVFLIRLTPRAGSCEVICLPTASVRNSTEFFDLENIRQSATRFYGCEIDRRIRMDRVALAALVNRAGGITADTPYGLPSPSGSGQLIAGEERLHLYGNSLIALLCLEATPDREQLSYYAELIALTCQACLTNFTEKDYLFLYENAETDISYTDYYDHAAGLALCFDSLRFSGVNGVWMNDFYYIL